MNKTPQFVYYICPFCSLPVVTKWPGFKVEMTHGDRDILHVTVDAAIHECPSGKSHYQVIGQIATDEYNKAIKLMMKGTDDAQT